MMARGVPKAGKRAPRGFRNIGGKLVSVPGNINVEVINTCASIDFEYETDEQILDKLTERFEILEQMTAMAIAGDVRGLIVSGPAGLGKSFTVEHALTRYDPKEEKTEIVKGYMRATGLYKKLWEYRTKGHVLVLDDADTVFFDDTSIAFLKAALDTTDRRMIGYHAETALVDDSGSLIPNKFEFNGTVIFITNYNFDDMIARGHKLAPHLQALVSRSMYIDLKMNTVRDYLIRIRMVLKLGILRALGLNAVEQAEVVSYIETNYDKLRELSLRMAIKIAKCRKNGGNWQRLVRVACHK